MVEIIRKGELPRPEEVPAGLRAAAAAAFKITLREPRPAGFPLLFSSSMQLIEPAIAFLHEHSVQRAHTADTLRTYTEILMDWFDTLEQSEIAWSKADVADLLAYRNRMLRQPSEHTGRPYSVRTINHRVRGVLRLYEWAVRNAWLRSSPLVGRANDFALARRGGGSRRRYADDTDRSVFVLRQFDSLPRPLNSAQARDLLAELPPPYDLMARWQLILLVVTPKSGIICLISAPNSNNRLRVTKERPTPNWTSPEFRGVVVQSRESPGVLIRYVNSLSDGRRRRCALTRHVRVGAVCSDQSSQPSC